MYTPVHSPTAVALVRLYLTPMVTVCAMRSLPALLVRTPEQPATTEIPAPWVRPSRTTELAVAEHLFLIPTVTVCAMRSTPALLVRTLVLLATMAMLLQQVM
jgi:hypothetical protein